MGVHIKKRNPFYKKSDITKLNIIMVFSDLYVSWIWRLKL